MTSENIMEKGKNTGTQHILLFPFFFFFFNLSNEKKKKTVNSATIKLSSANGVNLGDSKILMWSKGLKVICAIHLKKKSTKVNLPQIVLFTFQDCTHGPLVFSFLYHRHSVLIFLTLPHMAILGSSNSAANDMMSKIWTNGDTII